MAAASTCAANATTRDLATPSASRFPAAVGGFHAAEGKAYREAAKAHQRQGESPERQTRGEAEAVHQHDGL